MYLLKQHTIGQHTIGEHTIKTWRASHGKEVLDYIASLERKVFPKHVSWADEIHAAASRRNTIISYVLDDHSKLVAYIAATLSTLGLTIHRLAVLPACRRKGVGRSLVQVCNGRHRPARWYPPTQAVEHQALAQRSTITVSLHVDPANTPAVALYQQLGFVREGVVADYYATGHDAWRMVHEATR